MVERLLDILFPQSCPICSASSINHRIAPICPECWQAISPYNGTMCRRCGRPIVSGAATMCGDCLRDEPPFTYARGYGLYRGGLEVAIKEMKYHGIKRLSSPLAELLLRLPMPSVDVIIPVPLHGRRLRQRGFNQSALIARYVSKGLGRPLLVNSLVRTRDTLPQAGLSANERRRNIRGAFSVNERGLIYKKRIMLIDDVMTTGATVMECSRTLKEAGAGDIYVFTLALSSPSL
jgi:ComF family protein